MPGVRRAARGARLPRGDQELGLASAGDRGRRHRLLHVVQRHDRRRPRAGAARPRAVGRDRREAHAARRARVHAAGRRRHGERGAAGGAAHRGARRERHLHPAEQRRVRRDRRPHDRDERDRPAHEEHARRPRRRVPRLPDPDRRPDRAARGRGVRRAGLGAQRGRRSRARSRCSGARSRRRLRATGFSFVEVLTMCPTGWFIPTGRGARLHAARRSARCTSWAS